MSFISGWSLLPRHRCHQPRAVEPRPVLDRADQRVARHRGHGPLAGELPTSLSGGRLRSGNLKTIFLLCYEDFKFRNKLFFVDLRLASFSCSMIWKLIIENFL